MFRRGGQFGPPSPAQRRVYEGEEQVHQQHRPAPDAEQHDMLLEFARRTGAQGVVTYNLTPGLKLNATVGAGQTTSAIGNTGETNGASVGLSYQFQY